LALVISQFWQKLGNSNFIAQKFSHAENGPACNGCIYLRMEKLTKNMNAL